MGGGPAGERLWGRWGEWVGVCGCSGGRKGECMERIGSLGGTGLPGIVQGGAFRHGPLARCVGEF